MELNEGQSRCLEKLIKWWNDYNKSKKSSRQQIFEISGAAGTGKTTIIRKLIERLGLNDNEILFVAFVGKAALQMRKNGLNAQTIHSAIYYPSEIPLRDPITNKPITREGRVVKKRVFHKRYELDECIKLIVVDEAPMVDNKLAMDLVSFDRPIIALGDKHQLPPIFGKGYFLNKPDCILTEVMRQSEDSPILSYSQEIINAKGNIPIPRPFMSFGTQKNDNFRVYTKSFFLSYMIDELIKADIVICGTNSTRDILNKIIRKHWFAKKSIDVSKIKELVIGDKIICRKNNYDIVSNDLCLINGLIGTVTDINFPEDCTNKLLNISFKPDGFDDSYLFDNIKLNLEYFNGTKEFKDSLKETGRFNGELFEYGYAITAHLSQGSQYDYVIVFVEQMSRSKEFFRQWLYTAVTRASHKLILVI